MLAAVVWPLACSLAAQPEGPVGRPPVRPCTRPGLWRKFLCCAMLFGGRRAAGLSQPGPSDSERQQRRCGCAVVCLCGAPPPRQARGGAAVPQDQTNLEFTVPMVDRFGSCPRAADASGSWGARRGGAWSSDPGLAADPNEPKNLLHIDDLGRSGSLVARQGAAAADFRRGGVAPGPPACRSASTITGPCARARARKVAGGPGARARTGGSAAPAPRTTCRR